MRIEHQTRLSTCERHGPYQSRSLLGGSWARCPQCVKEKRDADEAKKAAEQEAVAEKNWREAVKNSEIPCRFVDCTLGNFAADSEGQKKALAFAKNYTEDLDGVMESGRGAILVGRPGTGKTHLAAAIGMESLGQGFSVRYTTVIRALRRIKDTWGKAAAETEQSAVASMTRPDLLIIDEVGVQFGSETEKMILFDVLNERYENRRPTLLISNLSVHDVSAYLGERVIDRLREDGGEVVAFAWESYRGKCLP